MKNNPLVTVNILSFNRKDELRITLTKVFEQDYKNIEVIVVDNASTDGTQEMVKTEFPEVKLIELDKNIGIAGWNKGFEAAKGEYVLVLDDDSYPDKLSLERALRKFESNPNLGIIAAKVINNRIGKIETDGFRENPDFFVGCGAIIKKEVYNRIGGFNKLIFIYLHELDYSARVYSAGYDIKYIKEVIVYHNQSLTRKYGDNIDPYLSPFRFYNYSISYYIFLVSYFSLKNIIKYLPKWIINRFIVTIWYKFWSEFLKFIFYIIYNLPKIWKTRRPLPTNIQKIYRFGNIAFIDQDYFKK